MPKTKPAPVIPPPHSPAALPPRSGSTVTTDITVDLVVNTEDQLRRIEFGLQKSSDDQGQPQWTIHFKLYQRTDRSTAYGDPRVSLDVVVDKNLHDQADQTAAKGLNAAQSAFLAGPGAKAALDSTKPGGKPAGAKLQSTLTQQA